MRVVISLYRRMSGLLPAAAVLLTVLSLSGCQQVKTYMDSRPTIVMKPNAMGICGEVDAATGEFTDARSVFSPEDKQVVAWTTFTQSHGEQTARFRWYSPEGHLVLDSGPIEVNPEDQLYDWRGVWSVLPLKGTSAQLMVGKWKVRVFLNEKNIATLKFSIES